MNLKILVMEGKVGIVCRNVRKHKTSSISIDDSLELDIEQSNMVQRLLDIYAENEQAPNVNFKYVEGRKLNSEVNKINAILRKIKTTDITATNTPG